MSLNFYTIIIPTKDREFILSRALNYYQQFKNIDLIICDSSIKKNETEFNNITYIHSPNSSFASKISIALKKVVTDFVCISADDDFLIEESLLIGKKFLNENDSFVSVQGQYIMFSYDYNIITFHPLYNNKNYNLESLCPNLRVKKSMNPYMHQLYALHRTKVLINSIAVAEKSNYITNVEVSCNLVGMLFGNHKTLPIFWMARDSNRYSKYYISNDNTTKNNNLILNNYSAFLESDDYINYKKAYIEIFNLNNINDLTKPEKILNNGINAYIDGINNHKVQKENLLNFKEFVNYILNNKTPLIIIILLRRIYFMKKVIIGKEQINLSKNWGKVKNVILKFPEINKYKLKK
jgi:glycosyltransferase domain-containing protein